MEVFSCCKLSRVPARAGKLITKVFRAREAVDQMGLLIARKEALVVVRAVEIDEKVPQGTEQSEGAGRAVDELPCLRLQRAILA